MEQSILKSTKKILGIGPDDDSFDLDILTHINNAFSNLTDMGIGPETGFVIESADEKWEDYLDLEDDKIKLSKVKTVIYFRTRLAFDPPTSAFLKDALEKQCHEAEWRLNVNREATEWTDPDPVEPSDVADDIFGGHTIILDGGDAG